MYEAHCRRHGWTTSAKAGARPQFLTKAAAIKKEQAAAIAPHIRMHAIFSCFCFATCPVIAGPEKGKQGGPWFVSRGLGPGSRPESFTFFARIFEKWPESSNASCAAGWIFLQTHGGYVRCGRLCCPVDDPLLLPNKKKVPQVSPSPSISRSFAKIVCLLCRS